MKEAIFYTLRRGPYADRWWIMPVTTERGTRVYGRDERGDATNASSRDCRGRFETADQAALALVRVKDAWKAAREILDQLNRKEKTVREEREASINAIISDVQRSGA